MIEFIEQHGIWLGQIAVILFGVFVFNAVSRYTLNKLIRRIDADKNYWQHALFIVARRYLRWLAWLLALSFALQIAYQKTNIEVFQFYALIRNTGTILIVAWSLFRFTHRVTDDFVRVRHARGIEIDITTSDAIRKLVQALILIIAALIVLQDFGFSVTGVMALGGVGGIVIGMAAKDLLANFFGGLMVYLDRPFQVGDSIRSPDREIEGKVEKIGWRLTTLRTPDKRPLYIPNATFTSITVENISRMSHRRLHETLGLRYQDAQRLMAIIDDLRRYCISLSEVDKSEAVNVNLIHFGESSIDIEISMYIQTTDYYEFASIKQRVLFKFLQIIQSHGADFAYPTRSVIVDRSVDIATTSH